MEEAFNRWDSHLKLAEESRRRLYRCMKRWGEMFKIKVVVGQDPEPARPWWRATRMRGVGGTVSYITTYRSAAPAAQTQGLDVRGLEPDEGLSSGARSGHSVDLDWRLSMVGRSARCQNRGETVVSEPIPFLKDLHRAAHAFCELCGSQTLAPWDVDLRNEIRRSWRGLRDSAFVTSRE